MTKVVDPGEYALTFFKKRGFVRKKCKICGSYFWTTNPELETCQDAPCTEYFFRDIKISSTPLSVSRAREEFLSFVEKEGHTRVKPRPVVARWRDDLYLTIASIVVFQPHVTSGVVEPPANPLVISQPCIRLEDIDNVGLTLGRHLTSFEMAAHHAFNYPDKMVYWKNRTVELAYEFFTKRIGIPEDYLVFKESWWEGGGNAGPSFEVAAGGLELATLVFMQYKVVNGEYEPIPIKIVDTGYGVERIAWFTSKKPTAFHVIYGSLLNEFRKALGLPKEPVEVLEEAYRLIGRLDPESQGSRSRFFERLAERTGLDIDDLIATYMQEVQLYTLLDHSKTLALMLGDLIVPSNTGEGYLVRLVLRRALRTLMKMNLSYDLLPAMIEKQIEYWSKDYYPHLRENKDYILDVTHVEIERFEATLNKGRMLLSSILKRKKKLTLDDLIVLYDSHGLPPELVVWEANRRGFSVPPVPFNFYSLIASRHSSAPLLAGKRGGEQLVGINKDRLSKISVATELLFHKDPYIREFNAEILEILDNKYVILDKTAFYPIGGGQYYDTGYIVTEDGSKFRVKAVYKYNNLILHEIDTSGTEKILLKPHMKIRGVVDWERRYRLMRHHTATHILMGALRRVLGKHVWQAGAEKTPEKARLDITHYKQITDEEKEKIEELVNKVIDERREIRARVLDKNLAEEKYGFTIYQGGVPLERNIRIVEITDWDAQACFGTHLSNTGEAGDFKIISITKLQDGIYRLEFIAGTRVSEEFTKVEKELSDISKLLGSHPRELKNKLSAMLREQQDLEKRLRLYRRLYLETVAKNPIRLKDLNLLIFEATEIDKRIVLEHVKRLVEQKNSLLVILTVATSKGMQIDLSVSRDLVERGLSAKNILMSMNRKLQRLKGGGRENHASGFLPRVISKEDLVGIIREIVSG